MQNDVAMMNKGKRANMTLRTNTCKSRVTQFVRAQEITETKTSRVTISRSLSVINITQEVIERTATSVRSDIKFNR